MPDAVLSEILLHVVLEEGDAALLNLSLVCSKFRSLVDTDSFRKRAHFCWLDSMYFLLHIWLKMFKIAPYHSISQLLCLNVYLCNNAFFFMLLISIYRCNKMENKVWAMAGIFQNVHTAALQTLQWGLQKLLTRCVHYAWKCDHC